MLWARWSSADKLLTLSSKSILKYASVTVKNIICSHFNLNQLQLRGRLRTFFPGWNTLPESHQLTFTGQCEHVSKQHSYLFMGLAEEAQIDAWLLIKRRGNARWWVNRPHDSFMVGRRGWCKDRINRKSCVESTAWCQTQNCVILVDRLSLARAGLYVIGSKVFRYT